MHQHISCGAPIFLLERYCGGALGATRSNSDFLRVGILGSTLSNSEHSEQLGATRSTPTIVLTP